jgi:hypothetical protein
MRSLGDRAESYSWAHERVLHLLLGARDTVLLTGGTPGPEVWGEASALHLGIPVVVYRADGTRTDSRRGPGRWCSENLKATSRTRDEAMVAAAVRAQRAGWNVYAVAFFEAATAAKSGTAHRARLAEEAGLRVRKFHWEPTPVATEAAPVAAE